MKNAKKLLEEVKLLDKKKGWQLFIKQIMSGTNDGAELSFDQEQFLHLLTANCYGANQFTALVAAQVATWINSCR